MKTQIKHSGSKDYLRITGKNDELSRVSQVFNRPVQDPKGCLDKRHVVVPIKKK